MGIDLLIGLLMLVAVYFGYQRGLILAIFSFVSVWLGILLAFKFSAWVAAWLGERISVSDKWLPVLAFLAILISVVLLVRLGAKAIEGVLELAQLGLLNRFFGAVLYLALILSISSALSQGLIWAGVLSATDRQDSIFIQYVQPLFLQGFQRLGSWMPGGMDVFQTLETFFQSQQPPA